MQKCGIGDVAEGTSFSPYGGKKEKGSFREAITVKEAFELGFN